MDYDEKMKMKKALKEGAKVKKWVFTKRETTEYTYRVLARTRTEAKEMMEEDEHTYRDECGDYIGEGALKSSGVDVYTLCSNHGRAWSDIPVKDIPLDDEGNFNLDAAGWHYNGECEAIASHGDSLCYHCQRSMNKGFRFTLPIENAYLNKRYHLGLIE